MTRGAIERFNTLRRAKLYEARGVNIELRNQTLIGCAGAPHKRMILEVGGVIVEIEQVVRFQVSDFATRGFAEPVRWESIKVGGASLVVGEWTVDTEAGEYVLSLVNSKVKTL